MPRSTLLIAVVVSAIIGAAAMFGAVRIWSDDNGGADSSVAAPTTTAESASPTDSGSSGELSLSTSCLSAADIYETVRPAVVVITSTAATQGPFGFPAEGAGSGIVIDDDGTILTNNHVVAGADRLEVRFADGSVAEAEIIGRDPGNDLAVVKVDPAGLDLTVARFGDSDAVRVGDPVLAIGNPFTLEGTLTQGIVSGVERTFAQGASTRPIRDMIQTDAPINPGNSGGPLLDCRGDVIGINTLLENPTGDNVNVGVGFAVPIDAADRSLADMLAGATVSHPWLGISGLEVSPALAEQLNLTVDSGVYVTFTEPDGPADSVGLKGAFDSADEAHQGSSLPAGGDVIVGADGQDMASIDELAGYLDKEKRPGDTVKLRVVRAGKEITLEATLAEWPE